MLEGVHLKNYCGPQPPPAALDNSRGEKQGFIPILNLPGQSTRSFQYKKPGCPIPCVPRKTRVRAKPITDAKGGRFALPPPDRPRIKLRALLESQPPVNLNRPRVAGADG